MGLFGNKEEEKKTDAPQEVKKEEKKISATGIVPGHVLIKPHVTEKALFAGVKNVYVFQIHKDATKRDVAKAVQEAFNVTVLDVNIAKVPGRKASRRMPGRAGKRSDVKKAYVTLKEGDKLQLI